MLTRALLPALFVAVLSGRARAEVALPDGNGVKAPTARPSLGEGWSRSDLSFDVGAATLRPSAAANALAEVARNLRGQPGTTLSIEVHLNDQGSRARNLRISQARAETTVAVLVGHGIDRARLTAIGFGDLYPTRFGVASQHQHIWLAMHRPPK